MDETIVINQHLTILAAELEFRFSTSSGPGGQHANRSATRVTLLFDVAQSPSLDEKTRQRLLKKLAPRLDKQGVLRLDAQESRSQHRNRETAVARFQALLAAALVKRKKRKPTKPSRTAVEKRLSQKRQRKRKKQTRKKIREIDD